MSPEELAVVERSWAELRGCQEALADSLARRLDAVEDVTSGAARAEWLLRAVADLVGLLPAPSRLGARARELADTWPDASTRPSFRVDGCAWLGAVSDVSPRWTSRMERSWRQAWVLLSDVLAEEGLSPFADPCRPDGGRGSPDSASDGPRAC